MKKTTRRIVILLAGIIGFFLLLSLAVNVYIDYRLPKLIRKENDTGYAITYKDLDVSLLSGTITADSVDVRPYVQKMDSVKVGVFAKVASLEISHVSVWSLLFSDRIKAGRLAISRPDIILYRNASWKKDFRNEFVKPFDKLVSVGAVDILNGQLRLIREGVKKPVLEVRNFSVGVDGITISEATLEKQIPFGFKRYTFSSDSIYYKNSPVYHISTGKIKTTGQSLSISRFAMLPDVSKRQFLAGLKTEKDFYHLRAESIDIPKMDWGFRDTVPFINIPKLTIVRVDANIYRSKVGADDMSTKPMYNQLLRELKLDLALDELMIRDSRIIYEEEVNFDRGPGVLSFTGFNLKANDIRGGRSASKSSDVRIRIDTHFMKESRLNVDWTFNVLDRSDGFLVKGQIRDFDTHKLDPFSKPYSNMKTRGTLDEVYFTVNGNKIESRGEVAMRYDDLKVKLYRKNKPSKENKIVTAIGNLLVKNDTKGKVLSVPVHIARKQNASFYNFLWRNVEEGMRKIIL